MNINLFNLFNAIGDDYSFSFSGFIGDDWDWFNDINFNILKDGDLFSLSVGDSNNSLCFSLNFIN